MKTWNPNTLQYEDDMEQHDVYLKDIDTDLAAVAKGNSNSGAAGKHLRANFSEAGRQKARATGKRMTFGGFTKEHTAGNEEGTFYMDGP